MKMFNDDEYIDATQDDGSSGNTSVESIPEVKVKIHSKASASLEGGTNMKVMLELSGKANLNYRPGLDLVTVLDVSGSQNRIRFKKILQAMEIVITKLSPIDRLSVVTFNTRASRLCPLRTMTDNSKKEIKFLVSEIPCMGGTNITEGIKLGLKVLRDRSNTSGRAVGIMLMSYGIQDGGDQDAARVEIGKVPVYTFCFGRGEYFGRNMEDVPAAIARKSYGGTFSYVNDTNDLSTAFAQCLAGLLTPTVQDLELTVTPLNSTFMKGDEGDHLPPSSSLTLPIGNLSYKETRKVIVDLVLPPVSKETTAEILHVTCKFSNKDGKELSSTPTILTVLRTSKYTKQENLQVLIEASRQQAAIMMKQARILADEDRLEDARNGLLEAWIMLEDLDIDNAVIDILKFEIDELSKLMESYKSYQDIGHRFALSSELSHERQRFAARGDTNKLRMFATPRMDEYYEQAKQYPTKPLPTIKEDLKKEQAKKQTKNRIGMGSLTNYIKGAIRNLRTVDNLVDKEACS